MIMLMKCLSIEGKNFFVSDSGAYPDDNLDDTNAIQLTINKAINYGLVSDIVFGSGIYTISATLLINNAMNLSRDKKWIKHF